MSADEDASDKEDVRLGAGSYRVRPGDPPIPEHVAECVRAGGYAMFDQTVQWWGVMDASTFKPGAVQVTL